jgi:hypothetical protein
MTARKRDDRLLSDRLIRKIRLWREYHSLGAPTIASRAQISETRIRNMNDPSWNPKFDTLRRLEMAIEPGFDADSVDAEYKRGIIRVKAWVKAREISRTNLQLRWIPWKWISNIADPDWAPSWFALHKLLALVPKRFCATRNIRSRRKNAEIDSRDGPKGKAA